VNLIHTHGKNQDEQNGDSQEAKEELFLPGHSNAETGQDNPDTVQPMEEDIGMNHDQNFPADG
jgi:hypothetical protein